MRFSLLAATALAAAALGQNLGDLPACCQDPLASALASSGCRLADAPCFCGDGSAVRQLARVVEGSCAADDQA
ncbi:hypothetical protein LTR04_000805, partial [Oleoguttula sp. CCFEE 6159]